MSNTKANSNPLVPNNRIINIIAPQGIVFRSNQIQLGETLTIIFGAIKYPSTVQVGWLSRVFNLPGVALTLTFEPADPGTLIDTISRDVKTKRGTAESAKDPIVRMRAEKGAEDGERMLRQIDQRGEAVGYMYILAMPITSDAEAFERVCKQIVAAFAGIGVKMRALSNRMREGLMAITPYYTQEPSIRSATWNLAPLSTVVGGLPFTSVGFNDGRGLYLGTDADNKGVVAVDLWTRDRDRTNSNLVVMGIAGMGKSATVKSIMMSEYARGTKIIFLDPESEYVDICKSFGGDWIDAGGGRNGLLNPFQIRPTPRDEDEDGEIVGDAPASQNTKTPSDRPAGMSDLALHLKTLDVFLSLYLPELSDLQRAVLKENIEEVYALKGITWETDATRLRAEDYPTFSTLHEHLQNKAKGGTRRADGGTVEESLSLLLRDISVGSDSFIWNGHTTLNPQSRMICLDTFSLQNTSDLIKRAQYFNLLTWCWEQMSRDRDERVLLVADEAYLMIDPRVPQSLVFLRNVAKRARKYNAGIAVISHSVVDFLDPSIRMYGQALLDLPTYKILMGADGKALEELASVYNLSDSEQVKVHERQRGHALMAIGSRRIYVHFDIPGYKLGLMGGKGGR